MKFFLISDNNDTAMGMRMAGIQGVHADTREETEAALQQAIQDPEVAVILITAKLVSLCEDTVYNYKLHLRQPLIVEVSDRHGDGTLSHSISRYVNEAIGINL